MAKSATKNAKPEIAEPPTGYGNLMGGWKMPTSDQEFVFTSLFEAPDWIDKGWLSWAQGQALALPAGDLYGKAPYTTKTARVGDKVMFIAAKSGVLPHFEVVENVGLDQDQVILNGTIKPAQASNASLEDMLKTGHISPEELGADARGQVAYRSPELHRLLEGIDEPPEPIAPLVTALPTPTT